MSDETNKTPLDTLTIERNSTAVKYVSAEKKRGDNVGALFYALDPATDFDTLVSYIGKEDSKNLLIARVNILAQKWFDEASLTEGNQPKPFDVDEFKKYAQEFSARGLTLAQINEEIARITGEITALATNMDFLSKPREEMLAIMTPKADRVKELRSAIAARKNKSDDNKQD